MGEVAGWEKTGTKRGRMRAVLMGFDGPVSRGAFVVLLVGEGLKKYQETRRSQKGNR